MKCDRISGPRHAEIFKALYQTNNEREYCGEATVTRVVWAREILCASIKTTS